jgi:two-component system sensor histidine kinase/response regulator
MDTFRTDQMTILAVDDTPSNLRALSDLLLAHGYKVRDARDGPTALEILAAGDLPDLILLDIYMPAMDGYTVCKHLKADPRTRDIPVIFISALSETENIVKGFEVGGADYIIKPFQLREVLARVASQLTLVQQRKQIEALRAQDRQYFESLNRMKDQFIRMATHDLRNPLNVILGYASVIDRLDVSAHDRSLRAQAVENVRQSVEKMRTLVTDLLDLAQFETNSYLSMTPKSLGDFLATCMGGLSVIAAQKNITLDYVPPSENVMVHIDENYMARVVDNLVTNALKYTPGGGQVKVRATSDENNATIEVSDTGLGIPEQDLPHIFDSFYRVRQGEYERIEGSGLGLSIVKTIVEQHGGKVKVESHPGQGSTFWVSLPRFQSPARQEESS